MRELLFGGILYLTGIGIILIIKPALFFTDTGHWKEFGIGRNPKSYTWIPFWLFCIFWGIVSYSMVYLIIRAFDNPLRANNNRNNNNNSNKNNNNNNVNDYDEMSLLPGANGNNNGNRSRGLRRSRLPPASGYYVLKNDSRNNSPYYEYVSPQSGPRMTRY